MSCWALPQLAWVCLVEVCKKLSSSRNAVFVDGGQLAPTLPFGPWDNRVVILLSVSNCTKQRDGRPLLREGTASLFPFAGIVTGSLYILVQGPYVIADTPVGSGLTVVNLCTRDPREQKLISAVWF